MYQNQLHTLIISKKLKGVLATTQYLALNLSRASIMAPSLHAKLDGLTAI